jgi:hypothetical protein
MKRLLPAVLLLLSLAAHAASLQLDCRALGNIGVATMSPDGTIVLQLRSPDGAEGVLAYKKKGPQYARILSHIGIVPGQHKSVPAFCD